MISKKIILLLLFFVLKSSLFSQWQIINSGVTSNLVDGCFTNDSTGFIISENGNVLKTINKGNTWSTTTTLSGFFTSICHVGIDTIYAGGNCIYKSYNGGLTWNLVTTLTYTITDLVFFGAKNGFAVVPDYTTCIWSGGIVNSENYKVYKSTNFGSTWQQNHSGCGHTSYFDLINDSTAVIPSGFVISGTHCNNGGGLDAFKTNNNGLSWYGIEQPFYGDPYTSFVNDTIGYYIQSGNQSMYSTIDGGISLSVFNINMITPVLKQCKFITQNQGYLVAQQAIFKTNSRGINWSNDYTSTNPLNYLFKNKDSVLIGLGGNGLIIKKIASLHIPIDSIYQAQLSNTSIDFGIVNINTSSINSFSIKNTGNSQTTFSITSSNDFKINFNTTSFVNNLNVTLNPSHDTLVYVQFNPLLIQNYKDTISVDFHGINRKIPVKGTGINALCGTIAQDTIICIDTLKICGDVTILPSAKMTICAGTYVQLLGNYGITVQGILKAIGTNSDSIIFASRNPYNTWKGITVYSNIMGDSTTFTFCKFKGSCSNSSIQNVGGYITIDHCNVSNQYSGAPAIYISPNNGYYTKFHLINSVISNSNGNGVYSTSDSSYILNNKIYNNEKGIVYSGGGPNFLIKDNEIYNNRQEGINGVDAADIIRNSIHDNIGGLSLRGNSRIENNTIYNNRSNDIGGIQIIAGTYYPTTIINQNLIFNNATVYRAGAGIRIESAWTGCSPLFLTNNTICNNKVENGGGGNNFFAYTVSVPLLLNFFNNIVYSPIDSINNFTIGTNTTYTVNYNCINQSGLSSLGQNNISDYPSFQSPTLSSGTLVGLSSFDWSLNPNSKCIEKGDTTNTLNLSPLDFSGNSRIYNSRIDIGAYEYQGDYDALQEHISMFSICYPNPFNKSLTILSEDSSPSEIFIYDISSRLLLKQKFTKSTFLNTEYLSEGIYIYEIKTSDGKSKKGKIIKL